MRQKINYLIMGIVIALAAMFIMEKSGMELASSVTAKESPRCKVIMGVSQGEGIDKFQDNIEGYLQKGYAVKGFSSNRQNEKGFYLQAIMTRE